MSGFCSAKVQLHGKCNKIECDDLSDSDGDEMNGLGSIGGNGRSCKKRKLLAMKYTDLRKHHNALEDDSVQGDNNVDML